MSQQSFGSRFVFILFSLHARQGKGGKTRCKSSLLENEKAITFVGKENRRNQLFSD